MRLVTGLVCGWMVLLPAQAGELDTDKPGAAAALHAKRQSTIQPTLAEQLLPLGRAARLPTVAPAPTARRRESPEAQAHESPLARAINRAATKGLIESSIEGYTEVLVACQKEQSVVLTTPLSSSDAQRDHCYRF